MWKKNLRVFFFSFKHGISVEGQTPLRSLDSYVVLFHSFFNRKIERKIGYKSKNGWSDVFINKYQIKVNITVLMHL